MIACLHMPVIMFVWMCVSQESSSWESVVSCYLIKPGDQTQVVRPAHELLYSPAKVLPTILYLVCVSKIKRDSSVLSSCGRRGFSFLGHLVPGSKVPVKMWQLEPSFVESQLANRQFVTSPKCLPICSCFYQLSSALRRKRSPSLLGKHGEGKPSSAKRDFPLDKAIFLKRGL